MDTMGHIQVLPRKKGKAAVASKKPAVLRLSTEVAEQILYLVDQETFASLVLTSQLWRYAAEKPQIYAFHLSKCPSYATAPIAGPFDYQGLQQLKKQFVQEAKRNLFSVFTRPRKTTINLISTTTSSAGAFPFGEAFEFSFSSGGLWCLAKSSSRLIVIDTAAEEPIVAREFKVLRKPLAAHILPNGKTLAVLSSSHTINIYNLEGIPILSKAIALDEEAHALALSTHGEVLAVAFDGGVEVSSLLDHALPMDKRAVKSERVDSLSFSVDGTLLLGTTQSSRGASTVIISAPYFTETAEDVPQNELISHMWTSQILFPYSSRDCSHAALLPRKLDHDANWTLTYDRVFESFRAVRTDDLRNGHTYFAGPKPKQQSERLQNVLTPCTLPAITESGELVAAGFLGNEIWLYGVPEDLDNHALLTSSFDSVAGPSSFNAQSQNLRIDIDGLPRWQMLVDKYRNVFAKGRRITTVPNVNQMCWVSGPKSEKGLQNVRERLAIGAPGGVSVGDDLEGEEMASVDGGRLVLLDFNWSPDAGQSKEITIEVGIATPEKLEEQNTDMATEIALVRRRTVARRDGIPRSQVASVADVLRPADEPVPPVPALPASVGFGLDTISRSTPTPEEPGTPVSPTHGVTLQEAANAFDGPYSHTSPRSRMTLYRSATAVETSRRRAPPALPSTGIVAYRRTDGTELPHESDADNWVPPPPPYTEDADGPLPDHLRQTLVPRQAPGSSSALGSPLRRPLRALSTIEQMNFRRRSSADVDLVGHASTSRHSLAGIGLESNDRVDLISPLSNLPSGSPASARAVSPLASGRRTMSTYESRSNRSSMYRAALRPAEPIASVAETVTESDPGTAGPLPIISTRPRTFRSSSLTLSGTNLQQRLDYPLPPPPQPGTVSPIESPSPARSSPRHMYSYSDIPRTSIAFSGGVETETNQRYVPRSHLATVPEPSSLSMGTQPLHTIAISASEPSAYTSNAAQFRDAVVAPPTSGKAGDRTSRFRSPFRRNAERAVSQPHLRSVSAMNFSNNTVGTRSTATRLDTIYSLNTQPSRQESATPPHPAPQGRSQTLRRPATQYERPSTHTEISSTTGQPESRAVVPPLPSGLAKRISRFRGRSEDPAQLAAASQRIESSRVDGYVGRGRRRARGGTDSEPWEEVYPRTQMSEATEKSSKSGGKCMVM